MARASGARAQMLLAFESVYGTAPGSGYSRIPFASTNLGEAQGLIDNELLGYGREPLAPSRDVITVDGDLVLPVDVHAAGFWLKALLGAPTTTGTTPKVHTFNSGATSLPSLALEKGLPEVPTYEMFTGCVVDKIAFNQQRRGPLQMTATVIGQGMARATSSGAGSPADITVNRFSHFQGAIKRNTVALGSIVSTEFTYSNNLDRVEVIRADGKIDGLDPGIASLGGNLVARLADTTLLDQASNGTTCDLEFSWTISANLKLVITAHEVHLPRPKTEVSGPGGIQCTFAWQGAKAVSPARAMTAVLTNAVASY